MHSILTTETHNFNDSLKAIINACNAYIANQIPENVQSVEALARKFVGDYLISHDGDIKIVVNAINSALSMDRSQSSNAEGELVSQIRKAVDIIEYNDLSLTMKN